MAVLQTAGHKKKTNIQIGIGHRYIANISEKRSQKPALSKQKLALSIPCFGTESE